MGNGRGAKALRFVICFILVLALMMVAHAVSGLITC